MSSEFPSPFLVNIAWHLPLPHSYKIAIKTHSSRLTSIGLRQVALWCSFLRPRQGSYGGLFKHRLYRVGLRSVKYRIYTKRVHKQLGVFMVALHRNPYIASV